MKSRSGRPLRVAALMHRLLATLVVQEAERPASEATLTAIDVAPDLSHAKVFVTHRGGRVQAERSVEELNRRARALRHALAPRLQLRVVPELRFVYDESLDRGFAIEALLRGIDRKDQG